MRFENENYQSLLVGTRAGEEMLLGRGFRKDRLHYFSDSGEIWFKTFPVGLDMCCQEAYLLLGLQVEEGHIMNVGAAVMYMETPGFLFDFSDPTWDVDNIDPDSLLGLNDEDLDWEEEEEEEEEDWDEDEDEDEDDEDETCGPKRVMGILPLSEMLAMQTPITLNHEAAMLKLGRWLPEGFSPANRPLPRYLAARYLNTGEADEREAYPILDNLSFRLEREIEPDTFVGDFDVLADRGQRYLVCHFGGKLEGGVWRVNDFEVDSYPSTNTSHGNLFSRPVLLGSIQADEHQAALLLVDFMDDAEFAAILKA